MWETLPQFGTGVLYAILVAAAYTFAVSVGAGRGRPRLLQSARLGAYATSAIVLLGVLLLSYAFVTHDFRLRYVARYSDRSMSTAYLLTSLWGGQDGSLLWWLFLLSVYVTACVRWLKGRYLQLQPYVIATLMVIVSFFGVVMLFGGANPFETSISGARLDGEGLEPLLRNFYMIIHPPSLYTGFVGCSVPFAFSVAALITGRLDNEWIVAVRKWMLFAFLFLSIGNALGMLWAYEELGWGGYWGWDPVENAACLPWFTATAYLHSTMIQERRNMFKLWNVLLIAITFFLTIFGTFLTRSGLIASVHSFAQSDIGIYFVGFMILIALTVLVLVIWRWPELTGRARIETAASREAMFVLNNWAMLGIMSFIAVATLWPKISELWAEETISMGPPFFNKWLAPIGLAVFALMGLAPLFGWRKTSGIALRKAFAAPLIVMAAGIGIHLAVGPGLGYPGTIPNPAASSSLGATIMARVGSVLPLVAIGLCFFNAAVIVQEFVRGVKARRKSTEEGVFTALVRLVDKSRRRYGGYIVHSGIVLMFLGFTGSAWTIDKEASLLPGQSQTVGDYELTYRGTRMEVDTDKRMIFADLDVTKDGKAVGKVSPARFIYRKPPRPTTEVSILKSARDDLYVTLGSADPQTKRATFQMHVNPLVNAIWLGVLVLIVGSVISLWPELSTSEVGVWRYVRASAAAATGLMFALLIAAAPTAANAPGDIARSPVAAASVAPRARAPVRPLPVGAWLSPLVGGLLGLAVVAARGRRRTDD